MKSVLTLSRILVVDDQPDVARTLCIPLKQAGALLYYAHDGEEAYKQVEAAPYDLLIIDMKMPPGDWGGLWLLEKLGSGGWKFPAVVLSGEGTKRQTIEALRLGASDWIDKSAAAEELRNRCIAVLERTNSEALEAASSSLPALLAHPLIRYSRSTDGDRRAAEGIRLLEAILRFTAIVGLCSTRPVPIHGMRQQFARPTMGTWFAICTTLTKGPQGGKTFISLSSCLIPDGRARAQVQEQIRIRNAMYHRGYKPRAEEIDELDSILVAFARRAHMSLRAKLAIPVSMTYDGKSFTISLLSLVGANMPVSDSITTTRHLRTGQPVLIDVNSEPVSMFPWIVGGQPPSAAKVLLFDGVKLRRPTEFRADSPLVYFDPSTGDGEIQFGDREELVWSVIAPWAEIH